MRCCSLLMVRGSLGAVNLGSSTKARYPFFAIKVPDLLELKAWQPHQDLLAVGKLIEVTDAQDIEVIFISHRV